MNGNHHRNTTGRGPLTGRSKEGDKNWGRDKERKKGTRTGEGQGQEERNKNWGRDKDRKKGTRTGEGKRTGRKKLELGKGQRLLIPNRYPAT